MKQSIRTISMSVAAGLLMAANAFAKENVMAKGSPPGGTPPAPTGSAMRINNNCQVGTTKSFLDINNVRAIVLTAGDLWFDVPGNPGYEVPKQNDVTRTRRHSIFSGAIWFGGFDNSNNLLITAQTFRQGIVSYWPGPLEDIQGGITDFATCRAFDRHWKINKSVIDDFITLYEEQGGVDLSQIPEPIKLWPGRGNPYLQAEQDFGAVNLAREIAPFVDVNGDNQYNPIDGDYPDVRGDQAIWYVINDKGNTKQMGGISPLGIGMEIRVEAFAFETSDVRNDMTFYRNRLYNRGNQNIFNTYMAQWCDPDLGWYQDDYVGFEVERGYGYCYNGDDNDEGVLGYGLNPPIVGIDYFRGPIADEFDGIDNDKDGFIDEFDDIDLGCSGEIVQGEAIIVSNFVYYNNVGGTVINGNPSSPQDHYNYMSSRWKNGNKMTFDFGDGTTPIAGTSPITGQPPLCETNFMFPGTSDFKHGWACEYPGPAPGLPPAQRVGALPDGLPNPNNNLWDEVVAGNPPGDRRFLQASGPFTLRAGARNEVTVAVAWVRAESGGARGSLNKSFIASDVAQKLFDRCFFILRGPNAPDVYITELDQELIMQLVPDEFVGEDGARMNTLSYFETDNALTSGNKVFQFQGYEIYQVRDNQVSFSDLRNADRSRMVAQCDIKDGVGKIINNLIDPEVDEEGIIKVPTVMVNGQDNGVFNTLRITEDLFASSSDRRLVNYKTYYYTVIAYAYNGNELNDEKYLPSNNNVKIYSAIPSKKIGAIINASYGQELPVTRILGTGNSGSPIELTPESEKEILDNYNVQEITYRKGPFQVKVADPTLIKSTSFRMKMLARLEVDFDETPLYIGDTIESTGSFVTIIPSGDPPYNYMTNKFPQKAGRAVVRRRIGQSVNPETGQRTLAYAVQMLNDADGGSFIRYDEFYDPQGGFLGVSPVPQPFRRLGSVRTIFARVFRLSDFWYLTSPLLNGDTIYAQSSVSNGIEQYIPELGISIKPQVVLNPGTLVFRNNEDNGYQESTLTFKDPLKPWLIPVFDSSFGYALEFNSIIDEQDPESFIRKQILGGGIVPYAFCRPQVPPPPQTAYNVNQYNPGYVDATDGRTSLTVRSALISKVGNIDIVFTDDESKWTRCAVIQMQQKVFPLVARSFLLKSYKLSLNKQGLADSVNVKSPFNPSFPSRGMSWFPGYAIDLDKGIRLNMAFVEDRVANPLNGDNLQWDIDTGKISSKSFIYIFNTPYDGTGTRLERELDSIVPQTANGLPNQNSMANYYMQNVGYVGLFRLSPNFNPLETEARVRVRFDRTFTSYGPGPNNNPEYRVGFSGKDFIAFDKPVSESQLDIIRVVPNPYYAYSWYETNQLDARIKVVNLPKRCDISIYTLNGTLVKRYIKDNDLTFQDWDLRNEELIPIGSGAYIIYVNAPGIGEKTIKWFGITRPIDLDTF